MTIFPEAELIMKFSQEDRIAFADKLVEYSKEECPKHSEIRQETLKRLIDYIDTLLEPGVEERFARFIALDFVMITIIIMLQGIIIILGYLD